MQRVDNAGVVTREIERIRGRAERFTTNWFIGPQQAESWAKLGILFRSVDEPDAVLIFRRDRDFFHVYHAAADCDRLSTALGRVGDLTEMALTTDIVGLPDDVGTVGVAYHQNGFRERRTLIRMVRVNRNTAFDADGEVAFATPSDIPAVGGFFDQVLDPLADQIPDFHEFCVLAEQRKILLVTRDGDVGGVLVFETIGVTSLLRYWYVNPAYRDQGIGARLIRTFFHLTGGSKRILLWVVSDNADAIAKYQHYGFQRERLMDRVMTRDGRKQSR